MRSIWTGAGQIRTHNIHEKKKVKQLLGREMCRSCPPRDAPTELHSPPHPTPKRDPKPQGSEGSLGERFPLFYFTQITSKRQCLYLYLTFHLFLDIHFSHTQVHLQLPRPTNSSPPQGQPPHTQEHNCILSPSSSSTSYSYQQGVLAVCTFSKPSSH